MTATDLRTTAADLEAVLEADDIGRGRMMRPPRLHKVATQIGVEYRQTADGGDWDWFYGLAKAEQARLRDGWMVDSADAMSPDEIFAIMPCELWLDYTRRIDAARAAATGRHLASKRYGGMAAASVIHDDRSCPTCGHIDGDELDVVGMVEIAERLCVKPQTVSVWKIRGVLPVADWTVGGRPAWRWDRIDLWAAETGRLGYGQDNERETF